MQKLFVYADFDWLDAPCLVGQLSYDSVRGTDTYGFAFDKDWLARYSDIFLGEDLLPYVGLQYAHAGKDIFVCFSDVLPDRWGRTLLNRREQIAACDEKRAVRRLTSFDNLKGIYDDHFRNHGFLLTRNGWTLSPAYDINPTLSDHQSLLINKSTNASDLDVLLASAGDYMLPGDKAAVIIEEVKTAMRPWREEARKLGLPRRDIEMFEDRMESAFRF